ncbi:MAG: metalloregulator ArsR/SmtB family transcription factor [Treponema sp.]|nr:metalloregulator ArsR/SmtB family transcription factor [Treponema sp.]
MKIEEVADICKGLSDVNRLRILEMLTQGQKCACELLEELQVTQPTLSHHMKVLGDCGLVNSYKEGKWQHYSINYQKFSEYKDYLSSMTFKKTASNIENSCCCKKGE